MADNNDPSNVVTVKTQPAKRGRRPKCTPAGAADGCEAALTSSLVEEEMAEKRARRGGKTAPVAGKRATAKAKTVYDVACDMSVPECADAETVIIKLDVQAVQVVKPDVQAADTEACKGTIMPLAYNGYEEIQHFLGGTDIADTIPHRAQHASCCGSGSMDGMGGGIGVGQYIGTLNASSALGGACISSMDGGDVAPVSEKPLEGKPAAHGSGDKELKAIRLLMDFDEKCKNGEWPASTSVHCYWCCHRFKNVPVGIPLSYNDDIGKFMVYGCFCSCECAAAYNLDSKESSDELMTRHAYLNMLARELGHSQLLRPAPSRLVLSMFGGPLSIDEFRERCHTSRMVLLNFPPMMTVTQQVEEINQRELRSEYRYIPIDNDRVNKYKEKIKLKRSKPLVNFKNTLDHAMNLKFT